MKKWISLLLTTCIILSTMGCGSVAQGEPDISLEPEVSIVTNPEYTEFLTTNGLEDKDYLKEVFEKEGTLYVPDNGKNVNIFVKKDDESGMIEITQYFASYDGMVSDELTIFRYPFPEGYTDDQRTAYDTYMKETYAKIEELSFADITYTMEEEYYQVEFLLRGLNANGNYYAAAQAGYYVSEPESEESKISYEKTVQGLLDNGYIAKYIEEVTE